MLLLLTTPFTRFVAWLRAKIAGWKTILLAAIVTLVGLADVLGAIDLRAFLLLIGVSEARVGGVMAAIGLRVRRAAPDHHRPGFSRPGLRSARPCGAFSSVPSQASRARFSATCSGAPTWGSQCTRQASRATRRSTSSSCAPTSRPRSSRPRSGPWIAARRGRPGCCRRCLPCRSCTTRRRAQLAAALRARHRVLAHPGPAGAVRRLSGRRSSCR